MIGFAQLRHIGRDTACGAIEREYKVRYICVCPLPVFGCPLWFVWPSNKKYPLC